MRASESFRTLHRPTALASLLSGVAICSTRFGCFSSLAICGHDPTREQPPWQPRHAAGNSVEHGRSILPKSGQGIIKMGVRQTRKKNAAIPIPPGRLSTEISGKTAASRRPTRHATGHETGPEHSSPPAARLDFSVSPQSGLFLTLVSSGIHPLQEFVHE
jgi:hypothetical protein